MVTSSAHRHFVHLLSPADPVVCVLCRIQLNSEEHWTKALKYMLTNLKWAIAWVCADSTLGELAPGGSPEPGEQA